MRPTPTAINGPSCRPPRTSPRGSQLISTFAQPHSWQLEFVNWDSHSFTSSARAHDSTAPLAVWRIGAGLPRYDSSSSGPSPACAHFLIDMPESTTLTWRRHAPNLAHLVVFEFRQPLRP